MPRFNGMIRLSGDGLPSVEKQPRIYKIKLVLLKVQ